MAHAHSIAITLTERRMRIVNLMSLVCAMLLLALMPAFLQFGRTAGATPSMSLAAVAALGCIVVLVARRP